VRRGPAVLLLFPIWLVVLSVVWWAVHTRLASGTAGLLFMTLPSAAAAITLWRLGQPSRWRRSGGLSG
jgi:hypothetical protein